MKKLLAAGLGLALALTAAGCGSGSGASSGGSAASTKPLQFYQSGDANQGNGYAKMAAKYKEQTGITVEIVEIPNADLKTKIKNAAQANDLPALARVGGIDPIWKDATVDLKDIATASKVKMDLAAKDEKGKVYSIPSDVTAVGMFINKTLFEKAGVKYPTSEAEIWTWDEFVAAAQQLT